MKFKLSGTVPTPAEVVAGSDPERDPAVIMAREALANLTREAAHAAVRLVDATARVDALKRDVPSGHASMTDLEAAIREQQAAALTLPSYQARVTDADKAVVAALVTAKATVIREAFRRAAELQDVADKIRPILEALAAAEAALDQVVIPLGASNGVAPVTWPASSEDAGAYRRARQTFASGPAAGRT
jgi:hypothetical protein